MKTRHFIVMIVGAVSGVCFAALAARSLSAMVITPHFSRPLSLAYAAIAAFLSYFAFRAATSGRTDEDSFLRSLWGGFAGAVVGLVIICAAYVMFRDSVRIYVARPLDLHLSQVSWFRVLVAFLCLGFAAGFTLRTPKHRRRGAETDEE